MENQQAEQTTKCQVCKQACDENVLVLCDGCDNAYHTYCMSGCECCGKVPNKQFKKVAEVPEGAWYCKHCRDRLPSLAEGQQPISRMYGWGNNTSGCLSSGLEKKLITTPTLLKDVEATEVADIAVGDEISVLLDTSGGVYTCGNGINGDLGHSDIVHENLDHFRRVEHFQSSKISKGEGPIVKIFCRADNVLAMTRNGHLYGWGGNAQGELGHMDYKMKRLPKKNSAFREMNVQVRDVAMGNHHTLVLGDDNVVYAMGENTHRQLGVSNNSLEWTPKRLCQEWKHDRTVVEEPDFPGPVVRIFAGGNSSCCQDRKGAWFVWGADFLRVAPGAEKSAVSFLPTHSFIPYPLATEVFRSVPLPVQDLAIGLAHCVLLAQDGSVWTAGDNAKGQLGIAGVAFAWDSAAALSRRGEFRKVELPAGMAGVFAFNGVSGCFGESGVFMWGDGATHLIPGEEGVVKTPKRIEGLERARRVRISGTHVLVLCDPAGKTEKPTTEEAIAEKSEKREREEQTEHESGESEAKKPEISA